jgi:hypothetical protein
VVDARDVDALLELLLVTQVLRDVVPRAPVDVDDCLPERVVEDGLGELLDQRRGHLVGLHGVARSVGRSGLPFVDVDDRSLRIRLRRACLASACSSDTAGDGTSAAGPSSVEISCFWSL